MLKNLTNEKIIIIVLILLIVLKLFILSINNQNQIINQLDMIGCAEPSTQIILNESELSIFSESNFKSIYKARSEKNNYSYEFTIGKTSSTDILANITKIEALNNRRVEHINTILVNNETQIRNMKLEDGSNSYFFLYNPVNQENILEFSPLQKMQKYSNLTFVYINPTNTDNLSTQELTHLQSLRNCL